MLYKRLRAALAVLIISIPAWIPAPPATASHRAGQQYDIMGYIGGNSWEQQQIIRSDYVIDDGRRGYALIVARTVQNPTALGVQTALVSGLRRTHSPKEESATRSIAVSENLRVNALIVGSLRMAQTDAPSIGGQWQTPLSVIATGYEKLSWLTTGLDAPVVERVPPHSLLWITSIMMGGRSGSDWGAQIQPAMPMQYASAIPILTGSYASTVTAVGRSIMGSVLTSHNGRPYITYYSFGVMGQVAAVRRRQGYRIPVLPETGYIALTGVGSCRHIGEVRWLSIRGGPWLRKIVVDCSHPRDAQRHTNNRLIAEVAYGTAAYYGFAGEGHARAAISR